MGIKRRGPLPEEGAPLAQSVRNQDVQPRVYRAGRTGTAGPTGRLVRVGVPGAVLPPGPARCAGELDLRVRGPRLPGTRARVIPHHTDEVRRTLRDVDLVRAGEGEVPDQAGTRRSEERRVGKGNGSQQGWNRGVRDGGKVAR